MAICYFYFIVKPVLLYFSESYKYFFALIVEMCAMIRDRLEKSLQNSCSNKGCEAIFVSGENMFRW